MRRLVEIVEGWLKGLMRIEIGLWLVNEMSRPEKEERERDKEKK